MLLVSGHKFLGLNKAPIVCLEDLSCKCVLGGVWAMPPKSWNFQKQPDADLSGPAPVDVVPTQYSHLAQCLLAQRSLKI